MWRAWRKCKVRNFLIKAKKIKHGLRQLDLELVTAKPRPLGDLVFTFHLMNGLVKTLPGSVSNRTSTPELEGRKMLKKLSSLLATTVPFSATSWSIYGISYLKLP